MSEWQPIETAPKDGSYVLLVDPSYSANNYLIARWCDIHHFWRGDSMSSGKFVFWRDYHACLWMPLPPPPSKDA